MLTRIREVRRARGLTLAEVASRCRPPTTAQTIGRLETGMRTVSIGWLTRIAQSLEVDPAELVTLADRIDVPLAATLGENGAAAPAHRVTLSAPAPEPADVGLSVHVSQGDYRAGDVLWLTRLDPANFASAVNRDVLAPVPVGRFAFGRLFRVEGTNLTIVPAGRLSQPHRLDDVPWIAAARMLVRTL